MTVPLLPPGSSGTGRMVYSMPNPEVSLSALAQEHIQLAERFAAHNYHPLPVVLSGGEGAWVTDVDGTRYLDCLAGYSALNFGHSHPRLVQRAMEQLQRLTLTSRAFHNDQLGPFMRELCALTRKEMALPMNTGAEAVETALKVARRWGQDVKGVDPERSNIITMEGNFHGRTTTIISFTTDPVAKHGYGPYTPGFRTVPFGDIEALQAAMDESTVAVLLEPIQGESGVVLPPGDYLRQVRETTAASDVLLLADEVQSGFGRTGYTFACERFEIVPDIYIMGKALGGGILPVSAISADAHIMNVITPGSHGSTFGGNPLSSAIGHEVCLMMQDGTFQAQARARGELLEKRLAELPEDKVVDARVCGLWAGLDINPNLMSGRELCERLMAAGVLAKDTHGSTIRLAPPLVVTESEIDLLADALETALGG